MNATRNARRMYSTQLLKFPLMLVPRHGIPLPAMAKKKIDTEWFYEAMRAKGLNVRDLAAKIMNSAKKPKPLDHARLVRILNGDRPMFFSEFEQLVLILDLDPAEAFSRARGRKS